MSKAIFITATGTAIGKTYVSALIAKNLCQNGFKAGYFKAALSGAEEENGTLIAGDAKSVCDMSGLAYRIDTKVSYTFESPVSPHLAAELEGKPIEISKVKTDFQAFAPQFDYLCVEGSGGIICPLRVDAGNLLMLEDVVKALKLSCIIVASAELGTINATLLTVAYIRSRGIAMNGIVLNNYDSDDFLHVDNKKQIERMSRLPVIACVKKGDQELDISIDALTAIFEEVNP